MINLKVEKIVNKSSNQGWILETDSKEIFSEYGLFVPQYCFAANINEALNFSKEVGYPLVCKVVSPEILHKSDVGGVIIGIKDENKLKNAFKQLMYLKGFKGVLVEKMLNGIELIIGAKNDEQFGPVILVGMGGVSVEIYKDTTMRMAPIDYNEADEMLKSLKCYPLLKGYRGNAGINLAKLKDTIIKFSGLLIDFENIFESMDLNPVICNKDNCFIADARIILK